jgi:transcriptional regulator with XRE-family HTH domain
MTIQCEALTRKGVRCRRKTACANRLCSLHRQRATASPDSGPQEKRELTDVQGPPVQQGEAERTEVSRAIRDLGLGVLGSLLATALTKLSGFIDWFDNNAGPEQVGGTGLPGLKGKSSLPLLYPSSLRADLTAEGLLMQWDTVLGAGAYWLEWVYRESLLSEWKRGSGPYTELPHTSHLISLRELRSCGCRQICWKVRAGFFEPGPRRGWRRGPSFGPFSETYCLEIHLGSENLTPSDLVDSTSGQVVSRGRVTQGDVLRYFRQENNLSAESIARQLGMGISEYTSLENGASAGEIWGPKLGLIAINLETPTSRLIADSGRSADYKPRQCGFLIRKHRQRKGLSIGGLAAVLEVSEADLERIENGQSPLETWGPLFLKFSEIIGQPVFNLFYPYAKAISQLSPGELKAVQSAQHRQSSGR